jgi:hypothetical protein
MRWWFLLLVFLLACSLERNRDFEVVVRTAGQSDASALFISNDGVGVGPEASERKCFAFFEEEEAAAFHTFLTGLKYDTISNVATSSKLLVQIEIQGEVLPHRTLSFSTPHHAMLKAVLGRAFEYLPPDCMAVWLSQGGLQFPLSPQNP